MFPLNFFALIRRLFFRLYSYYIFRKDAGVLGFFYVGNRRNVIIGDHCGINPGVFILGHNRIEIGSRVVLSARCMLIDSGLELKDFAITDFPKHTQSFICINDDAWIGAGAIILPGVTVGNKSIVGAGSVVTKDVPPFTIVAGNPARVIGRTDE